MLNRRKSNCKGQLPHTSHTSLLKDFSSLLYKLKSKQQVFLIAVKNEKSPSIKLLYLILKSRIASIKQDNVSNTKKRKNDIYLVIVPSMSDMMILSFQFQRYIVPAQRQVPWYWVVILNTTSLGPSLSFNFAFRINWNIEFLES